MAFCTRRPPTAATTGCPCLTQRGTEIVGVRAAYLSAVGRHLVQAGCSTKAQWVLCRTEIHGSVNTAYGFTAVPAHQRFSGPSRTMAKCRCGVSAGALPVVPT